MSKIKVKLSGRRPAVVDPAEWPLVVDVQLPIAYEVRDYQRGYIRVRRHTDGSLMIQSQREIYWADKCEFREFRGQLFRACDGHLEAPRWRLLDVTADIEPLPTGYYDETGVRPREYDWWDRAWRELREAARNQLAAVEPSDERQCAEVAIHAPGLSAEERMALADRTDADGRSEIATYAPGLSAEQRMALAERTGYFGRTRVAIQAPGLSAEQRMALAERTDNWGRAHIATSAPGLSTEQRRALTQSAGEEVQS